MLKIKNLLGIMLKFVFSHSDFPYCHHTISLIFNCTHLLPLKNMKFFLSIFLELNLIKIDSLMDASKEIRKTQEVFLTPSISECLCNIIFIHVRNLLRIIRGWISCFCKESWGSNKINWFLEKQQSKVYTKTRTHLN